MKELSPFIGCTFMEDKSICDDIIDFFNNSEYSKNRKHRGEMLLGLRPDLKDSYDLGLQFDANIKNYIQIVIDGDFGQPISTITFNIINQVGDITCGIVKELMPTTPYVIDI